MMERIGMTLVHFVWQGLAMATLLWMVLGILRRSSAQARYLAACLALAGMAMSPLVTYWILPGDSTPVSESAARIAAIAPPGPLLSNSATPEFVSGALQWVVPVWLAGAVLLTLRWLGAWVLLRFRIRRSPLDIPNAVAESLQAVKRRMNFTSALRVSLVDWLESPAVAGVLRPVLLLPAATLAGLTTQQLEAVLAHELAHVRRRDYLVNLLQTGLETILYYHPAVWWASHVVRTEREHCCDDIAIACTGDRVAYATALLEMEQSRGAAPQLAMAATGGRLKSRIARVMGVRAESHALSPMGLVFLALMLAAAWGGQRLIAQSNDLPDNYARWMNEDVVYIITGPERAEFKATRSNDERNAFITAFWERRGNGFKEEHYRRIGYANKRYSDQQTPGWRTDQGMIYITFGPPDEIESHPSEEREAWLYRDRSSAGKDTIYQFVGGRLRVPSK